MRRSRIVVVDDDLLMRWALAQSLRGAGYRVREARAKDAQLAFELGTEGMVIDCAAPSTRGLDLLAQIRASASECVVILMTIDEEPVFRARALGLGALAILMKPFDPVEVVRLFDDTIGALHAEGEDPKSYS